MIPLQITTEPERAHPAGHVPESDSYRLAYARLALDVARAIENFLRRREQQQQEHPE